MTPVIVAAWYPNVTCFGDRSMFARTVFAGFFRELGDIAIGRSWRG
jgi:hypothetical protein